MRRLIALLTDFGTRDHYAGTMKGVILGICPDATLVDITHDIPPHDVTAGALELAAAYKYFPAGHHLRRGGGSRRGSARRGLAADTGDYRFVAPDNGVLTRSSRDAAEEDRRADRAALRAADGEPHVRRARSLRAGRGVAGQGRAAPALGRTLPDIHRLDIHVQYQHERQQRHVLAAAPGNSAGRQVYVLTKGKEQRAKGKG